MIDPLAFGLSFGCSRPSCCCRRGHQSQSLVPRSLGQGSLGHGPLVPGPSVGPLVPASLGRSLGRGSLGSGSLGGSGARMTTERRGTLDSGTRT